jgi:hypothetical protein
LHFPAASAAQENVDDILEEEDAEIAGQFAALGQDISDTLNIMNLRLKNLLLQEGSVIDIN